MRALEVDDRLEARERGEEGYQLGEELLGRHDRLHAGLKEGKSNRTDE